MESPKLESLIVIFVFSEYLKCFNYQIVLSNGLGLYESMNWILQWGKSMVPFKSIGPGMWRVDPILESLSAMINVKIAPLWASMGFTSQFVYELMFFQSPIILDRTFLRSIVLQFV